MSRLLHIQSSPNLMSSVTRKLSTAMVEEYCRTHNGVEVEILDLVAEPLPHFGMNNMASMMLPPEQQSPDMQAAAALQNRLIIQLENANVVVIGAPMINFTICTQLKSWFDHVTLVGRTFQYSAPGQAKGLLFGHKTFIVEARGGDYSEPPFSAFDYQEPLLRMLCMFIGLYDVHFIRAEGLRAKEEEAPFILQRAEGVIAQLAAVEIIDRLFMGAGSSAMADINPMQRFWRDGHTVAMHTGSDYDVERQRYGRYLMGLMGDPFI